MIAEAFVKENDFKTDGESSSRVSKVPCSTFLDSLFEWGLIDWGSVHDFHTL